MIPFYIQSVDSVTVLKSDGSPFTLTNDQPAYERLIRAILAGDQAEIAKIADVALALGDLLGKFGEVTVYHGHVTFRGEPLHNYLVQRIVEMVQTGLPFEPMANLLNNVLLNPSRRAVQDLYRWLEAGKLPITPDGHIVAYKIVKSDYLDVYSGTFDNTPGNVCEMPRNMVNEDPEQTCADGLHFCSAEYLPSYGGFNADRKIVLVKVHPRDVVAFPTDYNLSKARCCRYEVLQEIDQDTATTFFPQNEFVFGPASITAGDLVMIKPEVDRYGLRNEPGPFKVIETDTAGEDCNGDRGYAVVETRLNQYHPAPGFKYPIGIFELVESDDDDTSWIDEDDDEDEAATILTRIELIESQLGLTPMLKSIPERLDAIDHELGLTEKLTPLVARIDRAESQLGLS
jgi:hypothetical protein